MIRCRARSINAFDVLEMISPIDDAGELVGTRHAPARLARGQQSIAGHTQSLNGVDGPVRTYCSVYQVQALRHAVASKATSAIPLVQLSEGVDLLEIVLKRVMDEPGRQSGGAGRGHGP